MIALDSGRKLGYHTERGTRLLSMHAQGEGENQPAEVDGILWIQLVYMVLIRFWAVLLEAESILFASLPGQKCGRAEPVLRNSKPRRESPAKPYPQTFPSLRHVLLIPTAPEIRAVTVQYCVDWLYTSVDKLCSCIPNHKQAWLISFRPGSGSNLEVAIPLLHLAIATRS